MSEHHQSLGGVFGIEERKKLRDFVVTLYNEIVPEVVATSDGTPYMAPAQIDATKVTKESLPGYQKAILTKFRGMTAKHTTEVQALKTAHDQELKDKDTEMVEMKAKLVTGRQGDRKAFSDYMSEAWWKVVSLEKRLGEQHKFAPPPSLDPGRDIMVAPYNGKRITNPFIV